MQLCQFMGQVVIEDKFELRITSGNSITDDEYVDVIGQVFSCITLVQQDAGLVELCAHWWVDAGIGTGNLDTKFPCEQGNSSHESTANTENIYFQLFRGLFNALRKTRRLQTGKPESN